MAEETDAEEIVMSYTELVNRSKHLTVITGFRELDDYMGTLLQFLLD